LRARSPPGPSPHDPPRVWPEGIDGHPAHPYDLETLDFDRLWAGREKTTALEAEVVRRAIVGAEGPRVLEVGPGGGRITPVLRRKFEEYVGVDLTGGFLDELRARDPSLRWLFRADVESLPFVDASFSAVSMIRVYNFLLHPERAIREMYRVLEPGGLLILSYHHVPSLGTLFEDVRNCLKDPRPVGFVPVTLSRKELLLPRRARVRQMIRSAGFQIASERATGLEDFGPGRWLPITTLVGLAEATSHSSLLPHRFLTARKPGLPRRPPAGIGSIVRCPDCSVGWVGAVPGAEVPERCPGCGRRSTASPAGIPSLLPTGSGGPADRASH
jgi:ubiquinone/menaquinone biosynthesis C-methylase UbiE